MRNLTCMIVDDEPLAVKMLENYVGRTSDLTLIASYNDPVKALSALDEQSVDIVFLDIQMPDLDGLNFSRMVPATVKIIFTTAFKQYAFDSYEVNAIDFLLKPIRYQKFLKAVEKVRERIEGSAPKDERTSMYIRVNETLKQIDFSKIQYVTGLKDYVRIAVEGEQIPLTTHLTMTSVENMLPKDRFMRVTRSYIVALDKIRSVDRNNCIYIANEVIHVTDAYKEEFLKYLKTKLPQ